jgi:hypothetical protein
MLGGNGQIRFLEFLMTCEPYEYAVIPDPNPKVPVPIFPDHEYRPAREPAIPSEHLSASRVHAAQFRSAAIPDNVLLYQNPEDSRPRRSLRLRKRVHRKLLLPWLGIEFYEANVGAQIGVSFAIRLNSLGPVNCLERECELFETVSRQLVETKVGTGKK